MTEAVEQLTRARTRLKSAGDCLRERPGRDTLAVLSKLLDAWSASDSRFRRELESDLRASSGFSPEVIRAGLERGLSHWTGMALEQVVERELGSIDRLDAGKPNRVYGFPSTAIVLAGSIPMPTLLAMLLPLVLQSPILVKTSQRDRKTAHHVAASISEIDSELGQCVEIVDFPRDDTQATSALLETPCIMAMGSDATLETLLRQLDARKRWVAYGHRLSLAALGSDLHLPTTAKKIAEDVALWDQSGCLSPAAIFFVGQPKTAAEFSECLGSALEEVSQRWPRGAIDPHDAAAIHHEREESRLRQAAGQEVAVHGSDDTGWTVISEADSRWRTTPLHRFVRVYAADDTDALFKALSPLAPVLSSVAMDGFGAQHAIVAEELIRLGASRLCAPGMLQAPPLGWHHDGRPLLIPFVRYSDDESSGS